MKILTLFLALSFICVGCKSADASNWKCPECGCKEGSPCGCSKANGCKCAGSKCPCPQQK